MGLIFLPIAVLSTFLEGFLLKKIRARFELDDETFGKRALAVAAGWVVLAALATVYNAVFPRDYIYNDPYFLERLFWFLGIAVFISFGATYLFTFGTFDKKSILSAFVHAIIMLIIFGVYLALVFTLLIIPAFGMLGGSTPSLW